MRILKWLLGVAAALAILFFAVGVIWPEVNYEKLKQLIESSPAQASDAG